MKKLLLHVLGAAVFVIIITLVEYIFFEGFSAPFTLSNWILGLSLIFWINREDERINSFIVSVFLPVVFIEGVILGIGIYYDWQHLPTLVTIVYILWKKLEFVNFRYVIYSSIIVATWVFTVYFTGLAYQDMGFYTVNLLGQTYYWYPYFGLPITIVFNIIFVYLLTKKEKEKS